MQLKSVVMLSNVFGLITQHVDCHMKFNILVANTFITYYYFPKLVRKISPSHNIFKICIHRHRKILIPIDLDGKEVLNRH